MKYISQLKQEIEKQASDAYYFFTEYDFQEISNPRFMSSQFRYIIQNQFEYCIIVNDIKTILAF